MSAHLKYRNRPTGGYSSAKEARRAAELKLLAKAGSIRALCEQVPYIVVPAQKHPATGEHLERAVKYFADFVYEEYLPPEGPIVGNTPWRWRLVVEDTKGVRTPYYIIKRKLMLFVHGIVIREL